MKTINGLNDNGVKNASNYKSRNDISASFDYFSKNKVSTQTTTPKAENNSSIKTDKKPKGIAKALTTFATMVSATVLCIAGTENILPTTSVNAQIEETWTTESEIYYYISFSEYNGEDDVYVVLYNDFTNRSHKVEDSSCSGEFEHLQANMSYTLAVKQGSTVITSKKIKTINQIEKTEYDDYQNSSGEVVDDIIYEETTRPNEENTSDKQPEGEGTNNNYSDGDGRDEPGGSDDVVEQESNSNNAGGNGTGEEGQTNNTTGGGTNG